MSRILIQIPKLSIHKQKICHNKHFFFIHLAFINQLNRKKIKWKFITSKPLTSERKRNISDYPISLVKKKGKEMFLRFHSSFSQKTPNPILNLRTEDIHETLLFLCWGPFISYFRAKIYEKLWTWKVKVARELRFSCKNLNA